MEFALLADEPSAAETVATWYFNQWCRDSGRYSEQYVREQVFSATNRDRAPLMVLAKRQGQLVGAAELKIREMADYPQYEFWVGGVYVDGPYRGQGIAAQLVVEVIARARAAGIAELYLQTEDLTGGLYAGLGFRPVEQADSKGVQVVIMVADLVEQGTNYSQ